MESTKYGVANLGYRPTVDGKPRLLEVHIFDFNSDLYGLILAVTLIAQIRDEVRFSSVEKMKEQIHMDIQYARDYIATHLN